MPHRVSWERASAKPGHCLVEPLLAEPLPFADGAIVLEPGYRPRPDAEKLERMTVRKERFRSP